MVEEIDGGKKKCKGKPMGWATQKPEEQQKPKAHQRRQMTVVLPNGKGGSEDRPLATPGATGSQADATMTAAVDPKVLSLCNYIETGRTYRASCKLLQIATGTMWDLIQRSRENREAYSRARAMAGRIAADEVLEIVDAATPETVQVARLRAEKRQWYAAKMNPGEFGERAGTVVNVGRGAGTELVLTDEILTALQERRRTVLEGMSTARAKVVDEVATGA